MSLIDLSIPPNCPVGMEMTVPGDSYDPHFPKPIYQTQLADTDQFVLQVQQFLKSSPLGISYPETPDGILSSTTLDSLKAFQDKLNNSAHTSWNLINGNSISQSNFLGALKTYKEIKNQPVKSDKIEQKNIEPKSINSDIIKQFQIILVPYGFVGDTNGLVSPELIQAAQNVENYIGKQINKSVSGMIWNNGFVTSPSDLSTALDLIKKKTDQSGNNK